VSLKRSKDQPRQAAHKICSIELLEFWSHKFKEPPYGGVKIWILFQNATLFYCTLYAYSPGGSTDAIASHLSFSRITRILTQSHSGSQFFLLERCIVVGLFFDCCRSYVVASWACYISDVYWAVLTRRPGGGVLCRRSSMFSHATWNERVLYATDRLTFSELAIINTDPDPPAPAVDESDRRLTLQRVDLL